MDSVKECIGNLPNKVNLKLYIANTSKNEQYALKNLLIKLSNIGDKLTVDVLDLSLDTNHELRKELKYLPLLEFYGLNKGISRFYGFPIANEFKTLITAIEDYSTIKSGLNTESVEFLKSINKIINIKVFVTPRCPKCPETAKIALRMTKINEMISTDVIEISGFPKLSKKYKIWSVPKIIINEAKISFAEPLTENEFINLLRNVV